jgi:sugar/nucleoside kinase (ribokinase family)
MKIRRPKKPSDTFDIPFPVKRPFDVVGFGLNSVDHFCVVPRYPQFDSKTEILQYKKLPGGQVATAVVFLAHLGLKAKYVGKIGGDELGQLLLQKLQAEDIDIANVLVEQNAINHYAFIIIDQESGERTILYQRDRRLDFGESELPKQEICSGRILHLDAYDADSALKAAIRCQEQGILVSADLDKVGPNCRELIQNVDFLIASESFPSEFTGIADPVESFLALGKSFNGFLSVTLGARGAMTCMDEQCMIFPGLKVDAVDTTGAGDIFHGGFLYGLLQNWPLERIMAFAHSAAGLSCGYLGAWAGIRPLPEILSSADQLLSSSSAGGKYAVTV